ncbi:RHS repeat-associated core domain-containing protein [Pseudomonas putida]|uniref:RHS repeat-associated core domain-containing protein n=1 Tax=Pseudomonas putida TaxID=303 RepID=UPI003DA71366
MRSKATLTYSAYGYSTGVSSAQILLGFNAEPIDTSTGYYPLGNGYRLYSPVIMRFVAPDSWSPFGKGGVNTYGYCAGDPINNLDPDGHVVAQPLRRHAVILKSDDPTPQTAQHLNQSLNRQRLQTGRNSHSDPLTQPPQAQQPPANGNPLANGGRMPFEDRRNPSVPLSEVVTLANELAGAKQSLAAPVDLALVHDPEMRADYLADLTSIRSEVPKQEARLNIAMVSWFHS